MSRVPIASSCFAAWERGMGEVYAARGTPRHEVVALKTLLYARHRTVHRLKRECRADGLRSYRLLRKTSDES
jgi:hypothetical protein